MSAGEHYLIVGEYADDDTEFDIEHPADCPRLVVDRFPDGSPYEVEDCAVGFLIRQEGVSEYFRHIAADELPRSSAEPVATGRHRIEAWHETHRGFDYVEYDAGVRLVPIDQAS